MTAWGQALGAAALGLMAGPAAAEPVDPHQPIAETQPDQEATPAQTHGHTLDLQSQPHLRWDPDWPRVGVAEYVATGVFVAGALGALAIPPSEERWTTDSGLDRDLSRQLQLGDPQDRDRARDASDVLLTMSINHLLFDNLVVTWWGQQSGDVAWEMAWMNLEALSLNAMLNGLVAGLTSRQRPYVDRCADPYLSHTSDCRGNKRYRSFFSGHTSTAFTVAGLVCQHHAQLPLYGGGASDALACSTSLLVATTVGAMRVVSAQHYVSDVVTGAAVGTLTGLGLPWLLHYRGGAQSENETAPAGPIIGVVPGPLGGTLWGVF